VPVVADLRIGVMEQFYRTPVAPVMKDAVRGAARTLERIGFQVDGFEPQGLERAPNLWSFFFGQLPAPFTKKLMDGLVENAHWTAREFLEPALAQPAPTAEDVVRNLEERDGMRARLLRQMGDVPLLLLPACGIPAFRHRERRWKVGEKEIGLFQAMMPVTPWNLLGFPAAVVPYGVTEEGLPVGVQIVGRPYSEELILEVAVRLEEARGPFPGPAGFGE